MDLEYTQFSLQVEEIKEQKAEGDINIGVFTGHLAAYAKDRMDDVFVPGAFTDSIRELQSNDRPVRMLRQHTNDLLVGGFPAMSLREDDIGLAVVGNINLDVQAGAEAFSLMKQGVLTDMSIGFSIPDWDADVEIRDGIRFIKKANIWEGSLVTEPANAFAQVSDVKNWTPREAEKFLASNGKLSNQAAKFLAGHIKVDVSVKGSNGDSKLINSICEKLSGIVREARAA